MKSLTQTWHKAWRNRSGRVAVVCGLLLLALGSSCVILSLSLRADTTTTASFQAEAGTKTGVTTVSDASAAGGSAVQFGAVTTPDPGPLTCNLNATTANFAAQVSAATTGQVICLASGNYGTWNGTNKAITITKQAGATPTMNINFGSGDSGFTLDGMSGMYGEIYGPANNITIRNSAFSSVIVLSGLSNANVLLDKNTHNNISNSGCQGWAGRIMIIDSSGPAGVTVSNSILSGGNLDGIRPDVNGGVIIEGNQLIDIKENGPDDCQHTDSIQFYGGQNIIIRNNYFRGGSNGIVAFDRTRGNQISGNVCVNLARGSCVTLYSDTNSVVEHNVVIGNMDVLEIDRKTADPAGVGTIFRNNIGTLSSGNGSTVAVNTNNLFSGASSPNINGSPIFVGGANPTTWAGFKLASNSPGFAGATDGGMVGIRP